MVSSCISHCSYLTPAVTIPVLKDIIISVISITISPCNTGQCEGGEAISSLFVSLTKQEDSVVHSIHSHSTHWPGQSGGNHLPVRAGSEELSGVQIVVTTPSTSHHQNLRIGSLVFIGDIMLSVSPAGLQTWMIHIHVAISPGSGWACHSPSCSPYTWRLLSRC